MNPDVRRLYCLILGKNNQNSFYPYALFPGTYVNIVNMTAWKLIHESKDWEGNVYKHH